MIKILSLVGNPFTFFMPGGRWLFFTLLFYCLLTSQLYAQKAITKKWDKTLGGGADDLMSTMVPTPDGGYLLGGTSFSTRGGDKTQDNQGESICSHGSCYFISEDFWLIKIDAQGQKVWDKTLGGRDSDQLKAMVALPEGGYVIAGISYSNTSGDKSTDNKGFSDYWVVKIDLYGNKVWDHTYGGSSADDLTSILRTPDGGFLLGGTSFSDLGGDKTSNNRGENSSDYWIIKINSNGTKEWDQTLGGSNADYLTFLTLTPDNHYLVGGSSNSRVSGDKTAANKQSATARAENTYNGWVVKVDSRGNIKWDKTYGFSDRDNHLTAVYYDASTNGFLLGGSTAGLTLNDYDYDYLLARVDENGNQAWLSTYGGESNDFLGSITLAPDNDFLLGGTSTSRAGKNKSEKNKGYEDFWLLRIANRWIVWDKTIGGNNSDYLRTMLFTPDQGYLFAGTSASGRNPDKGESSRGGNDYWVMKWQEVVPSTPYIADFRYGGSKHDNFTQLIKTGDNGYLLGGYSESNNTGDKSETGRGGFDYWVVKTDATGKEMWNKRFGGPNNDFLNSIMQTPDGGYLLGGSSESGVGGDKSGVSRGDRDFWVVKISSNGAKEWDRTLGGRGFEDLRQLRQLASGNYILGGYSISPAGDDKSEGSRGGYDYWVVTLNPRGNKISDYRFGGNAHDYLQDVVVSPDGSLLLGGTSVSGLSGDKSQMSQGSSDYWVVKVAPNGEQLWDKSYGGTEQDNLQALAVVGNSYILAGYSNSPANDQKSRNSQGGNDFWFLKINADGQKIWDKTYGGAGHEELRSLSVTTNGNLLLGGTSFSEASGDKTQNSRGDSDYWMVQTTSAGTKQWDKRYGGLGKDELRSLLQDHDDSYLLAGRSNSEISGDQTQAGRGSNDYWLVKVALPTSSAIARTAKQLEAPVTQTKRMLIKAYPNPFQEQLTIRFMLPETQPATVKLLDSQGREVTTLFQQEAQANQTYELDWPGGKQANGLYLLQLQTPTQQNTQRILRSK